MNTSLIRFNHFYEKKAYCKLQEIFGSYDYKRGYEGGITEPYDDLTIIYHELEEFSCKEDWKELEFKKDFLIPGIQNISKVYIERFNNEINDKGLFTEDLIEGFAKRYREKLIEIRSNISKSKLVDNKIKFRVLREIFKIDEYVEEFFKNPYPNINEKIRVNWNRTKIIYFFHLLRANNEVAWIEDVDIGRVIDNVFEYKDPINMNNYKAINNSRKHFTAFKNTEGRPESKAIEDIKKTFMNEDFYNV